MLSSQETNSAAKRYEPFANLPKKATGQTA
jgi:hypothetical protein